MATPGDSDPTRADQSVESLLARLRKQDQGRDSPASEPPSQANSELLQRQSSMPGVGHTDSRHIEPPRAASFALGSPAFNPTLPAFLRHGYQPASVSSPIISPQATGPHPRHPSGIMSPVLPTTSSESPALRPAQGSSDRTSTLLNLLKFAQPAPASPAASNDNPAASSPLPELSGSRKAGDDGLEGAPLQENQRPQPQTSMSASELMTSLLGKKSASGGAMVTPSSASATTKAEASPDVSSTQPPSTSSAQTQNLLLKLLNQTTAALNDKLPSAEAGIDKPAPLGTSGSDYAIEALSRDLANASLGRKAIDTAGRYHETATSVTPDTTHGHGTTPTSAPHQVPWKEPQPLFHYVSPFGRANTKTSRQRQSAPGPSSSGVTPPFNILKRPDHSAPEIGAEGNKRKNKESSPEPGQVSSRRKLELPVEGEAAAALASLTLPVSAGEDHDGDEPRLAPGRDTPPATKQSESVVEALDEVRAKVSLQATEAISKADTSADLPTGDGRLVGNGEDAPAANDDMVPEPLEPERLDDNERDAHPVPADITEDVPEAVTKEENIAGDDANNNDGTGEGWEGLEGEEGANKDERIVRIFNFPMKPFVSLALEPAHRATLLFSNQQVLEIARLRKEFDQMDRTLATASSQYIMYAMVKHGGLRLIRQDDGRDTQLFSDSEDRIFNLVSVNGPRGSASSDGAAVIATGVSGSVYWAPLTGPGSPAWNEGGDAELQGLIFPPISVHEENTSGGQLKTRAKRSSRHPQLFAIGRGKAIYIIWPAVAQHQRYLPNRKERIVDMNRYLRERCIKITTGKAGKDLVFSEDDTTIASLDKAGRLKIWDVRQLIDEANGVVGSGHPFKLQPIDLTEPLVTYVTTLPDEKAWPSSVLFIDKLRPYTKASAQRYLLVGMKQNHTLQLWDLSLGRPVQELHFPHDKESDAICSVAFHSSSGIIVVGHPTRNSIYFLTLSAPKYHLPAMSQAAYVQRLAVKDPSVSNPDATAIITGLREYSFGSRGQLRSVDILNQPNSASQDGGSASVFEIYAMHSRGVSCITIKPDDLGWDKDGRARHPVDAVAEGLVRVDSLRPPQPSSAVIDDNAPSATASIPTPAKEPTKKAAGAAAPKQQVSLPTPGAAPVRGESSRTIPGNTLPPEPGSSTPAAEKAEKRKKKRGAGGDTSGRGKDDPFSPSARPLGSLYVSSPGSAAQRSKAEGGAQSRDEAGSQAAKSGVLAPATQEPSSPTKVQASPSVQTETPSTDQGISGETWDREMRKLEKAVSSEFTRVITTELGKLHRRIAEDTRIHQAAGDAKLEAVLRLVSSTLTENVEKSLARIVMESIQTKVLPVLKDTTTAVLERSLTGALKEQIRIALPSELSKALPKYVSEALKSADIARSISGPLTDRITQKLESEIEGTMVATLAPRLKVLMHEATQTAAAEVEARTSAQIDRLEISGQSDSQKIEQLQDLVHSLLRTVSRMATVQTEFQQEILKLQRHAREDAERAEIQNHYESGSAHLAGGVSRSHMSTPKGRPAVAGAAPSLNALPTAQAPAPAPEPTEVPVTPTRAPQPGWMEESEIDTLRRYIANGDWEAATVKWLQSPHQADIFRRVFARSGLQFLRTLSPLVLLSVTAAVATTFESELPERLTWLENCLALLPPRHVEVREHIPRIMSVIMQRLESVFIEIARHRPQDPVLERIVQLSHRANALQLAASGA